MLLTTQYLEEAEQLADRIAILHEGRIIANGTLAELKQLFPPATVEYVEKQPTLEDIFLAIVGRDGATAPCQRSPAMTTHVLSDTTVLPSGPCATSCAARTRSSPRPSPRSPCC